MLREAEILLILYGKSLKYLYEKRQQKVKPFFPPAAGLL